ncbi:MAG: Asp23/Gls24 family envelope stress response protein [Sciscionella sp.]
MHAVDETLTQPGQRTDAPEASDDRVAGRTTVSEQAIERIATRLVADCHRVGGTPRRVLGVGIGQHDPERDAQVRAHLHGHAETSLAVRCSVPYPMSVAAATEQVRGELRDGVLELTGLTVRRVDITVTALSTAGGARVR